MAENTETETAALSAPEFGSAPDTMPVPQGDPALGEPISAAAVKKKRSVRSRNLFAGALALGLVGGAAGGYTIQELRKPTPLPPLSVAQPVYPRGPVYNGVRPAGLPAAQDDATVVDGDLRKLLLPAPAGATVTFDPGWVDLIDEADTCDDTAYCFDQDLENGVARVADTAWRSNGLFEEIRILQYLPGYSSYAESEMTSFKADSATKLLMPDGIAAAGWEKYDSHHEYDDHAVAVHGDVAVYFWVTSPSHVPDPSIINGLITQQMARL
jgi:hypothetical protein